MASRPHTTYKKRQKELARMEKQRDKAAKRLQRKLEKQSVGAGGIQNGEEPEAPAEDSGESSDGDEPTL